MGVPASARQHNQRLSAGYLHSTPVRVTRGCRIIAQLRPTTRLSRIRVTPGALDRPSRAFDAGYGLQRQREDDRARCNASEQAADASLHEEAGKIGQHYDGSRRVRRTGVACVRDHLLCSRCGGGERGRGVQNDRRLIA